MNQKSVHTLAGIVVGIAALLHLYRIIQGLPLIIGTYLVPMWISAVAVIIAGYLSYRLLTEQKKK